MRINRNWPTRKTQLAAIAVLIVGALAQLFMPPLTRQKRAERLYTDAWFDASRKHVYFSGTGCKAAVQKITAALRLDPGNSLYEQALVWHYDPADLPTLLKSTELGPKAKLLADWLVF